MVFLACVAEVVEKGTGSSENTIVATVYSRWRRLGTPVAARNPEYLQQDRQIPPPSHKGCLIPPGSMKMFGPQSLSPQRSQRKAAEDSKKNRNVGFLGPDDTEEHTVKRDLRNVQRLTRWI